VRASGATYVRTTSTKPAVNFPNAFAVKLWMV